MACQRMQKPVLLCPAGTVLNLKVKKTGNEPVALEDAEYPEWLWSLLDKKHQEEQTKQNEYLKWKRRKIHERNTADIKNSNFLALKK